MRDVPQTDTLPPVLTLYLFILGVGAVGALAYMMLFLSHVPGAKDERFGKLEALPADLQKWIQTPEPSGDGLVREQRHLLEEGSGRLILQVRFRDPKTQEIVRVLPEEFVKRRRIRD